MAFVELILVTIIIAIQWRFAPFNARKIGKSCAKTPKILIYSVNQYFSVFLTVYTARPKVSQYTLPDQKFSYTTKYPCSESTKYPVGSKDEH